MTVGALIEDLQRLDPMIPVMIYQPDNGDEWHWESMSPAHIRGFRQHKRRPNDFVECRDGEQPEQVWLG